MIVFSPTRGFHSPTILLIHPPSYLGLPQRQPATCPWSSGGFLGRLSGAHAFRGKSGGAGCAIDVTAGARGAVPP